MQVKGNAMYAKHASGPSDAEWQWQSRKRSTVTKLLSRVPSGANLRFLEVGCRDGRSTSYFAEQCKATSVYGSDVSLNGMEGCKERGIIPTEWIAGQNDFPFEAESLDVVLAMDVIEHILDPETFLTPIHNAIRPHGWLLLTIPNLCWWWNRVRIVFGTQPVGAPGISSEIAYDPACDTKHIRYGTLAEWHKILERHGFFVLDTVGYNYPKHLRFPNYLVDDFMTNFATMSHSFAILSRRDRRPD